MHDKNKTTRFWFEGPFTVPLMAENKLSESQQDSIREMRILSKKEIEERNNILSCEFDLAVAWLEMFMMLM